MALAVALIAPAGCGGGGGGATATSAARPAATGVTLKKIGQFNAPLYVTQPPGSTDLYVVERAGVVKIVRNGKTLPAPFLDISNHVSSSSEQGLLSIAFAPDYQSSGLLYAYYTDAQGNQRIVEFRRDPGNPARVTGSERLVLKMPDFASNHNGGLMIFGPNGHLYVGTGDGGGEGDPMRNGQDLASLLGKLLRIDPRQRGSKPYTVPRDNPFVGRPGALAEIYAYGLRNPWRFDIDPQTKTLVIADVGQNSFEEVDVIPLAKASGANFGWSAYEGDTRFNQDQSAPGAIFPALVYPHSATACSITGGYVVRDPALPSLDGRYVYSDFCGGELRSFGLSGTKAVGDNSLGLNVSAPSSFGTDNAGHVYVTSFNGPVYELIPN